MDEKIDKMIEYRRRAILFLVLLIVSMAIIVVTLIVMSSGDYSGSNDEFSVYEASGEVVTKSYDVESFEILKFFYDDFREERTLFTEAIPNVKIVDSDKLRVDVRANSDLLEILEVVNEEDVLGLNFQTEYYQEVSDSSKSYKRGLYVDCDAFDVTIYAPVSQFYSSAEINLDFQGTETKFMRVVVVGEIREGRIYNVDAKHFELLACGATTVEVSGKVGNAASISVYHNSKVDATKLFASNVFVNATSQIFGFSWIDGDGFSTSSAFSLGYIITWCYVLLPLLFAALFTLFLVKHLKLKHHIDVVIAKIKAKAGATLQTQATASLENNADADADNDDKNLDNLEKTEENLLQNDK